MLGDLLSQTWTDFELVVVDDASTDDTARVLDAFKARRDPRLRVVHRPRNLGIAHLRVHELRDRARGRYVYVPDSDDRCQPTFLERAVRVLDHHPIVGFVHCRVLTIDAEGLFVGMEDERPYVPDPLRAHFSADYVCNGREELRWMMRYGPYPNLPTAVLMRRSACESVGWMKNTNEWLLYMKMAAVSDVAYLSDPLVSKRRHGKNLSSGRSLQSANWTILDSWFDEIAGWAAAQGDADPELRYFAHANLTRWRLEALQRMDRDLPHAGTVHMVREFLALMKRDPGLLRDPKVRRLYRRLFLQRLPAAVGRRMRRRLS
jgi:glycosyltransferase involved in cell wall biosynthesis